MLVTRTPVRVSFCGGGTDLAAFYRSSELGGLVTSVALQAHIYVTVNQRFDDSIRVSYSQTETVDSFEDLQHELVREAMRITGVTSGVEITTIADIPGKGTGLGSSSSVTVGLLHALHLYAGRDVNSEQLAQEACEIEIEVLGQTIGKQDQYAAAFGGLNQISFNPDETVKVTPSDVDLSLLSENFCLVWTGLTRKATPILEQQSRNTSSKMDDLISMRMQAEEVSELLEKGDWGAVGSILGDTWSLKRSLTDGISNPEIDSLYDRLMELGCSGGKLLGAGGGGFILVQTPPGVQEKIRTNLSNKVIPLVADCEGSILLLDDRDV
ncbi:MAG: GHMP kinase [Euryarchaeota archaeon]|nr:GHMP kinase [Euryarchaeota archaeon]